MSLRLLLSIIFAFTAVACFAAKPASTPIALGQTVALQSKAMNERRVINIWTPPGYTTSKKRYPVLYVIDGGMEQDFLHVVGTAQLGMIWGRNAEAIIVGIETKDRRKELVGPTADPDLLKRYPTTGRSADFRRFIREEVKSYLRKNYRTADYDAVIGESLAGLFIVETWLREPGLFKDYAAISPSLWWDKEAVSKEIAALPESKRATQPRLYLNIANEGAEMQAGMDRVVSALKPAPFWCYAPRPDLTHATIYQQTEAAAIQFLLPSPSAKETEGFELTCTAGGGA